MKDHHNPECECCKTSVEEVQAKQAKHIEEHGFSVVMLPDGFYTIGLGLKGKCDYFVGIPNPVAVGVMVMVAEAIETVTELEHGALLVAGEQSHLAVDAWVFDVPDDTARYAFPWGFSHPLLVTAPTRYRQIVFPDQDLKFPWQKSSALDQTLVIPFVEMLKRVYMVSGIEPSNELLH